MATEATPDDVTTLSLPPTRIDARAGRDFTGESLGIEATATGAAGVAVKATAKAGIAVTASGTAAGVEASATTGFGVRAVSNSSSGIGVRGQSQNGLGVSGIGPTGVLGESNSSSHDAVGVLGESSLSTSGVGVKGTGHIGVRGESTSAGEHAIGMYGSTPASHDGVGVRGDSRTGVLGVGSREGVQGSGTTGVLGVDTSGTTDGFGLRGATAAGCGVKGESDSGPAVWGVASGTGVGVRASAAQGLALIVEGPAVVDGPLTFRRSGVCMVPAGERSVVVQGLHPISEATIALAVCQKDLKDVAVRSAVLDAAAGTLTVTLTKPPTWTMPVGWFLVN